MMSIDPTRSEAPAAANTTSASAANAAAAKEQFLSLLVAQISNQNPMKPMDDKDLITQLAQFSSVEQAIETNSRLASLQESQAAAARINMASLVGKQGTAQTKLMHVDAGQGPSPVAFTLDSTADQVSIRMVDAEGNLSHSIKTGNMAAGAHHLAWDGSLASGMAIGAGDYAVQITATDRLGNQVPVHQEIRGTITGVDLNGKEPFVHINGVKIRTSDVVELNG